MKNVGLILFGEKQDVSWNLGEKFSLEYSVDAFCHIRDKILSSQSDYLLFWSSDFAIWQPSPAVQTSDPPEGRVNSLLGATSKSASERVTYVNSQNSLASAPCLYKHFEN